MSNGPGQSVGWRRTSLVVLVVVLIQSALLLMTSGARLQRGTEDTDIYYRYATGILAGRVPYRDFVVEYPPLALALFLGPAAIAGDVGSFKRAFAGEMLLCNAVGVGLVAWWVQRLHGRRQVIVRLAWYTGFLLILGRLIVTRFDAAPMVVGFAATLAWANGQRSLGGVAASAGTFLKIYPAALAFVALAGDWKQPGPARRRGRGLLAFGVASALISLVWFACGGFRGVLESIRYQTGRGFEYGSLAAGAQMLAARLLGGEIQIVRDHAAYSAVTRWSSDLLRWVFPVQVAVLGGICWVHARSGGRDLVRCSSAAVLGLIGTGKVFSPQFLIWLIPYMAVLDGRVGRQARWLFAAVAGGTLLAQGSLAFWDRTSLGAILAYNGRNTLVVWLWMLLVLGPLEADASPERS